MKPIAIYGAGCQGRETLMLIRQINDYKEQWNPIGFFDDSLQRGKIVDGLPVLGNIENLNSTKGELHIVIALGYPEIKKKVFDKIQNPLVKYASLIHPSVSLAPYQHCTIGEGTVIAAGNIITIDVTIGKHVLLNLKNTIAHDSYIGDFTSMMSGCNVSGHVTIKEGVFMGLGASVINDVTIGTNATIGAGAVVLKDIEKNMTVVGVPAKPVSKLQNQINKF